MTVMEQDVEQLMNLLIEAVEHEDTERIHRKLDDMHPSTLGNVLSSLPLRERHYLWQTLSAEEKGLALAFLSEEVRLGLIQETSETELVEAVAKLELDDLTDLIQDLPYELTRLILQSMELQNRQRLEMTLSYPENTAGGLMDMDVISIRQDVTVDVVLRYLRRMERLPPSTDKLMLVDRDNHFIGVLPIARILTCDPATPIKTLKNADAVVVPATMPDVEVAALFRDHDLLSTPVLDNRGRLIGRITVDDIVDVISEEAEQAIMRRDGLDEEEDVFSPVGRNVRRRAPWLAVNLFASLVAIYVVSLFEASIAKVVALAILMPLNAGIGGVAGSQTLTLMIRGLALNKINSANQKWLIVREILVGLVNGVIWSVVIGLITWAWFQDYRLSLVIVAAVIINLLVAASLGAVIPIVQRRVGVDPALAGHVVLTAFTDVFGFLSFLGLATLFLL
jgi:magnesium transporter